ncbi:TVP38/TMEM64 family protein [Candidatus Woesearchaeota archaeon]|jgi:uncharacterized membrane protein YdjX (TVP38/TMEM64 family)|nr:TVP38/TMEM64 family protein [Candidatus Woesearchaeota archaeon]
MQDIKKRHHKLKYLLIIGVVIALYFLTLNSPWVKTLFDNPEGIRNFIISFGLFAPLIIILLQTFQTIISIIPSQLTTIIAGFLFGPVLGAIYSLIGVILGSAITFLISRKYGKKLALKFFEKKDLVHLNLLFKQKKGWALLLARLAPIFPNDLVSFGAGLTNMKFRNFNIFSTLGFSVQIVILSIFGGDLFSGEVNLSMVFISSMVGVLIVVALFEKKIKRWIIKDFHELEKEGKIIEKAIEREFKEI